MGNLNVFLTLEFAILFLKVLYIDFSLIMISLLKCCREIAASLKDFSNRWCKRENVEPDALKEWKSHIFKIIDIRISSYSRYTHILPPKHKSFFVILSEVSRIYI